ncbi:MAG: DUF2442 domain-containing protein [Saprospiraceae bacterium]
MQVLDKINIDSIDFIENNIIITINNKVYTWNLEKISSKLLNASDADRRVYQFSPSGYGIHWPKLDEDLSINGLLKTIEPGT